MKLRLWFLATFSIAMFACGGHHGGGDPDGAVDGDGNLIADATVCTGVCTDAPPFTGMCTPGGPQCSNCIDDDADGFIDGADPECTGSLDNDESTFATGIPGDNKDAVKQDCFFDGNSGAGDDGCNIHVCCLLGATSKATCPIGANTYDPTKCPPPIGTTPLTQKCIDNCSKLAPPGCDCFGCCTECVPGTSPAQCYDIDINPATSPNCTAATISNPAVCKSCTKSTTCGSGTCGGASCILCPGQNPSTLPVGCNTATCPIGETSCGAGGSCPTATYCSNGCCIGVIQ